MVEYGCKIQEKVNTVEIQIQESVQGTNSDRKETRTQMNGLEQKEKINIQPEQNEEKEFQKRGEAQEPPG